MSIRLTPIVTEPAARPRSRQRPPMWPAPAWFTDIVTRNRELPFGSVSLNRAHDLGPSTSALIDTHSSNLVFRWTLTFLPCIERPDQTHAIQRESRPSVILGATSTCTAADAAVAHLAWYVVRIVGFT